jgi:HEAT repeat protein
MHVPLVDDLSSPSPFLSHERGSVMKTPTSVKEFIKLLTDADESVRIFAALRLGLLGADAQPAVPALAELLGSENVIDRRFAALALGQIGPAAKGAVPPLVKALGDADGGVGKFAVEAIQKIDPKAVTKRAA